MNNMSATGRSPHNTRSSRTSRALAGEDDAPRTSAWEDGEESKQQEEAASEQDAGAGGAGEAGGPRQDAGAGGAGGAGGPRPGAGGAGGNGRPRMVHDGIDGAMNAAHRAT